MPPFQRWSMATCAAKILCEGLANGDIDANLTPKQTWMLNNECQCFKLDSFRSALNKIKGDLGVRVRRGGTFNDRLFVVVVVVIVHDSLLLLPSSSCFCR